MFDDAIDPRDSGLLELTRRLESYADARLSPSLMGTSRMRANVMNAALRRAALVAADPTLDPRGVSTAILVFERARAATRRWRRPAAVLMAACLTVAMVAGTALTAKPGGPLYATRIWIEMANLPARGIARAQAEISRLEARLQEAQQASAEGDGATVNAALAAYSVIVVEAAQGAAGDPAASAAIETAVSRHVVVLTLLADTVPAAARAGIQNALTSSTKVLDDLDGTISPKVRGPSSGAGAPAPRRPDGTKPDRPTQVGGTSAGTAPERTSKPDKDVQREPDEPARDNETPPPGQARPGGTGGNGPDTRPSVEPEEPNGKRADADKSGGT